MFLSIDGPQLYSGSVPNVTMLPLSFTSTPTFTEFFLNSTNSTLFNTLRTVTATATPEPGTASALLLAFSLGLGCLKIWNRVRIQ